MAGNMRPAHGMRDLFLRGLVLCGFNDARRFRLVFQRMEGMKPGEFRKTKLKAKED